MDYLAIPVSEVGFFSVCKVYGHLFLEKPARWPVNISIWILPTPSGFTVYFNFFPQKFKLLLTQSQSCWDLVGCSLPIEQANHSQW